MFTLVAKNLMKSFGEITPVKDVSLTIKEGEIFGILGPSGAGKSTILNILIGMLEPDSGFVRIIRHNPLKHRDKCMKFTGVVPQHNPLYDELTVWGNIELFGVLYGLPYAKIKTRGEQLLRMMRLENKRNSLAESLSGGERKRLNVILALLHNPKLLLLDEPTAGLDPYSKKIVWNIIRSLKSNKTSVVIITHLMEEAEQLCDRIAILDRGKFVVAGTSSQLLKKLRMKAYVKIKTVPALKRNYKKLEKFLIKRKLAEKVESLKNSVKVIGVEKNSMDRILRYLERLGERVLEIDHHKPDMEEVFIKATRKGREK
jgi:ABC-2 type transport system ATP-binding protein